MKLSQTKKAVIDDTILFIWKQAKHLNLEDVNKTIQQLIMTIEDERE